MNMSNLNEKTLDRLLFNVNDVLHNLTELEKANANALHPEQHDSNDSTSFRVLFRSIWDAFETILDGFMNQTYTELVIEELEQRDLSISPPLKFHCAKELIELRELEKSSGYLSESLEYVKGSGFALDSPDDVALTNASVSYLTNKPTLEIEGLYKSAIEFSQESERLNNKRHFPSLEVFMMFVFVIREKVDIEMLCEFYCERFCTRDEDSISEVVQDFMNMLDFPIDFLNEKSESKLEL